MTGMEQDELRLDLGQQKNVSENTEIAGGGDIPLPARLNPHSKNTQDRNTFWLRENFRRAIDRFSSISFPACRSRQTSLAELIAKMTDSAFIRLSGVISTVSDIRRG